MKIMVKIGTGIGVVVCALIVLMVAIFLPELIANRAREPEGLWGSLLFGAFALVAGIVLTFNAINLQRDRSDRVLSIASAAIGAAVSLFGLGQMLSANLLFGIILLAVGACLLAPAWIGRTQRKAPNS